MRGAAALYVVFHHAALQVFPESCSLTGAGGVVVGLLRFGHWAVDLFIVLSGFCLMLPVLQNAERLPGGAPRFYWRRCRRILPPYYFAVAVSLLLVWTLIGQPTGTHWDVALPVTGQDVTSHLALTHDLSASTCPKMNHVLWSIAVECRIYLVFPLLIVAGRRVNPLLLTAGCVLGSLGLVFALQGTEVNLGPAGTCPHFLGLFALGMLAARVAFCREGRLARLRQRLPWSHLLAVIVLLGLLTPIPAMMGHPTLWAAVDVWVGVAAACLLIAATGGDNGVWRFLTWRPLVFLGTFAYSLYLIHAPLLQIVSQYVVLPLGLDPGGQLALTCFVGAPFAVVGAYLFFLVAERPFLSRRDRGR